MKFGTSQDTLGNLLFLTSEAKSCGYLGAIP